MLDMIAHRYGVLPSELMRRGDTLDIWVFDVAQSYRAYQEERNKKQGNVKDLDRIVQDKNAGQPSPELVEAYNKFRSKRGQ